MTTKFISEGRLTDFTGLLSSIETWRSSSGLRVIIGNCTSGGIYRLQIVVPTAGSSDKGEPHCLEHLCFRGCQRLPISGILDSIPCLSNGTNAYTTTDRTVYTASTASEEGLRRLLALYIEHLQFPLLDPSRIEAKNSFSTEVFHVTKDHKKAGVVFSEMETAMTEPADIACYTTMKAAYPEDSAYRWNTGGDPKDIPSLTLDDVLGTHRAFYDASNMTIVVMGSFKDPKKIIETLELYESTIYPSQMALRPETSVSAVERTPWAHSPAPAIPDGCKVVRYSPSERDGGDHYLTYSFRLPFPWSEVKNRVALELILKYLVEGSGAVLNEQFVEGEDACAGSIDFTIDNLRWSVAVVTLTDVDSASSSNLSDEISAAISNHMSKSFDYSRLRSIIQRDLWKQKSSLETQPSKALLEKIVSYVVNCGSESDCDHMMAALDEVSVYEELLEESENYWRNFVRHNIELPPKYVVIVQPKVEDIREPETESIVEQTTFENDLAAFEEKRKRDLEEFTKEYNQSHAPLMSVDEKVIPANGLNTSFPEWKPFVLASQFASSFTTVSLAASPDDVLDMKLEQILHTEGCRKQLVELGIDDFVDEILAEDHGSPSAEVVSAVQTLYDNPDWDNFAQDSDDEDDEDSDDGPSEESDSEDDSMSESDEDYAKDLGSIDSEQDDTKYQGMLVSRYLLRWALSQYTGKHLLHIVSKCLFNSHLRLDKNLYESLERHGIVLGSSAEFENGEYTITPAMLEKFLNSNFLDCFASNGYETSHAFNSLISVTLKVPKEFFVGALQTACVILSSTCITPNRLLAMAKQDLSYLTECFRQGDAVVSDLQDLISFGVMDSAVMNQSYLIQNVLLRAVITYPLVFAPMMNFILSKVSQKVEEGDCIVCCTGNTEELDKVEVRNSITSKLLPKWKRANGQYPVPSFPSIAAFNRRLNTTPIHARPNMSWNEINVGHIEVSAPLPKSLIPEECADPASHGIYRHDEKLVVVENYLKAAEGPIFQPVRDSGAAYSASMTIDEESRAVLLSLHDATHPDVALKVALRSIKELGKNCDALLTGESSEVPFPTVCEFQQAKSAALYQMVKDLEDPNRVAEAHIDNMLRNLDNNWMFDKVSRVTYEDFLCNLKEIADAIGTEQFTLTAVSNSKHAEQLRQALPELIDSPSEYITTAVSVFITDGIPTASADPQNLVKALSVFLKARLNALAEGS